MRALLSLLILFAVSWQPVFGSWDAISDTPMVELESQTPEEPGSTEGSDDVDGEHDFDVEFYCSALDTVSKLLATRPNARLSHLYQSPFLELQVRPPKNS